MNRRFLTALGIYAILIAIAFLILHGTTLKAVLILFGGLIVKTFIAWRAGW
jgi:hypothetical protein